MTQPKKIQPKKSIRIYPGIIIGGILIALVLLALVVSRLFPKPLTLSGQKIKAAWSIGQTTRFYVGDLIPVTLTIEAANGVRYQLPDLSGSLGRLELKEQCPIRKERRRGGSVNRRTFLLCGWEPGKYSLTALTINYRDPAGRRSVYRVPPYNIRIYSLLPKGKSKSELLALDVKATKKPLSYPANLMLFWGTLAGIALLTLGCFLVAKLLHRLKRSPEDIMKPEVIVTEPANSIANRRLAALEKAGYLEAGNFKAYYAELSECAREYLENRFGIRALEMTTEEFLTMAASSRQLRTEDQVILIAFLQAADLVKFAKFIPARAEAEQDLNLIRRLVKTTDGLTEDQNSSLVVSVT
jgi:hypothetical protein